MKKVELSDGREVLVGVRHGTAERGRKTVRCTEVYLKGLDGSPLASEQSLCSPKDNFCRRTGRRAAATRLLRSAVTRFSLPDKEDRRRVFLAVCPEYAGTS